MGNRRLAILWALIAVCGVAVPWQAPGVNSWWDRLGLVGLAGLGGALGRWVGRPGLEKLGTVVGIAVVQILPGLWQTGGKITIGTLLGGFIIGLAVFGAYCVRRAETSAGTEGPNSADANRSRDFSI
jgi:hypothetical protein